MMKSITSLYIHFPFCRHLCNYCDFYKHKLINKSQILSFESLLIEQINYHEKYLSKHGYKLTKLETLYLGGGTPSLWNHSGVEFIKRLFKDGRLSLDKNCEFTLEVDPDAWNEENLDEWMSIGVNRFSIGAQAFSTKYMSLMDRSHTLEDVEKTVKYFSDRKLNFSVDLMLGLPCSEERDVEREINQLLKFDPPHISVYILKTRKNYTHILNLPDDNLVRSEYLLTSKLLTEAGFRHYEVSNFAKDNYHGQHNLKYWNYESVAAIGPTATGFLVLGDSAQRYQWKTKSIGLKEEKVEGESLVIEKLFLGLRSSQTFNLQAMFDESPLEVLEQLHLEWEVLGYLQKHSSVADMQLTSLGFLMCDSIIDDVFKKIDF